MYDMLQQSSCNITQKGLQMVNAYKNSYTNTTDPAIVAFYDELNNSYIEEFYSTAVDPTIGNISAYTTHCMEKCGVQLTTEQYNDALVYFENTIKNGMNSVFLNDANLIAALNANKAAATKV